MSVGMFKTSEVRCGGMEYWGIRMSGCGVTIWGLEVRKVRLDSGHPPESESVTTHPVSSISDLWSAAARQPFSSRICLPSPLSILDPRIPGHSFKY